MAATSGTNGSGWLRALFGPFGIGAIAGAFLLGRVRDRMPNNGMFGVAGVLYATASAALVLAPGFPAALATLVFAGLAWMAVATTLAAELQSAELRIPTDISIIGFDDLPVAQTAPVPLTTIRTPYLDVARRSTSPLLREIADAASGAGHTHQQLRLQPQLVVRESTARPGT